MRIRAIGDSCFLKNFSVIKIRAKRNSVIPRFWTLRDVVFSSLTKQALTTMYIPVAAISPMMHGFSPPSAPLTYLFFMNLARILLTMEITTKDGITTAVVATTDPQKPAWLFPI